MTTQIFVDETKERGYVVVAATVQSSQVADCRKAIGGLILPGQRRVHLNRESNARRGKIMSTITTLGIRANVYDAGRHPDAKRARDACLTALVEDLAGTDAQLLVLERDDSAVRSDNALLYVLLRKVGLRETLRHCHMRAHEESLLAIPDAIAWCWARGGQWRAKAQALVATVRKV
jgi:hypothetical protein